MRGLPALLLWVAGQAAWLSQGYNLEFLGLSTFLPGLWVSSLVFFLVNCWILGIIVGDFDGSHNANLGGLAIEKLEEKAR